MSQTASHPALAHPAKPDEPPKPMAIVLTKKRVIRQGGFEYHVPPGSVIGTKVLPAITTFNPGGDAKLIPAGTYKPGDMVED